jgi:hypothetical protein
MLNIVKVRTALIEDNYIDIDNSNYTRPIKF